MTQAQDLIDRAWDAKTGKTQLKLARQAIAIDPNAHHRPIARGCDRAASGAS